MNFAVFRSITIEDSVRLCCHHIQRHQRISFANETEIDGIYLKALSDLPNDLKQIELIALYHLGHSKYD